MNISWGNSVFRRKIAVSVCHILYRLIKSIYGGKHENKEI